MIQPAGLASGSRYVVYGVVSPAKGKASVVAVLNISGDAPPAGQAIDFTAPADQALGAPALTLSATGGLAGVPIAFASTTPGVCQSGGGQGAMLALLQAGTCTVNASQAGNAQTVTRSFAVHIPATSGTTLAGSGGALAQVGSSGAGAWQFVSTSKGVVPPDGLPPLPAGYRFVIPQGLDFALAGGAVGSTAQVTWQLPLAAPADAQLWKLAAAGGSAEKQWRAIGGVFGAGRRQATFSVIDGGEGDDDQVVNGMIVDPVFLVAPVAGAIVPAQAVSVPTLSDGGRGLLSVLLAGWGLVYLRRRHAPSMQ